jgi:ribonuclease Z
VNTNKQFGATLFSRGLYSSWCHLPRYNLVFDCGEGCATALGNDLANVTKIFLGHGHGDHTLGLPSFVGCRNTCQGTSRNEATMFHNKPLEIFYPAGENFAISDLIEFIKFRCGDWLRYSLTWTALAPGDRVKVGHKTYVRAFETLHQKVGLTLGYVIEEERSRLKAEYRDQSIPALLKSGAVTSKDITEDYVANQFAYCLDAYKICDGHGLTNCPHAVMDCTFINPADRTDPTHFTFDEAYRFCHDNGIKNMYAAHISPRYDGYGNNVGLPFPSQITVAHIMDNTKINYI